MSWSRKEIRSCVGRPFAVALTITHVATSGTGPRTAVAEPVAGCAPVVRLLRPGVDGDRRRVWPPGAGGPRVLVARHSGRTFADLVEARPGRLGLGPWGRGRGGRWRVLVVAVDLGVEQQLRRRRPRLGLPALDGALQILVRPEAENGKAVDDILLKDGLLIPFLAVRRPGRLCGAPGGFVTLVGALAAAQRLLLHPGGPFAAPTAGAPHFGFAFHGDRQRGGGGRGGRVNRRASGSTSPGTSTRRLIRARAHQIRAQGDHNPTITVRRTNEEISSF